MERPYPIFAAFAAIALVMVAIFMAAMPEPKPRPCTVVRFITSKTVVSHDPVVIMTTELEECVHPS